MITGKQICAARALLGWTQEQLSEAADISMATVNNVEREVVDPQGSPLEKIRIALEWAGVEILDEQNGTDGGPRLRLQRN